MDPAADHVADPLRKLARSAGEAVPGGANQALELDNADIAWFVESGALDVFAVEPWKSDRVVVASRLKHVFRARPGQMVFGLDAGARTGDGSWLVAKGTAGSRLRRVRLSELQDSGLDTEWAGRVDAWVIGLTAAVTRDIALRPAIGKRLSRATDLELASGHVIAAQRGVIWVAPLEDQADDAGAATWLDTEEVGGNGVPLVPLTSTAWLTAERPVALRAVTSAQLAGARRLSAALAEFHRLILRVELLNRKLLAADAANAALEWSRHQRVSEGSARHGLFGILKRSVSGGVLGSSRNDAPETDAALPRALDAIGAWEGITFRAPRRRPASPDPGPALEDFLHASGIRGRQVALPAEDRWWRGDAGALLGFLRDGGEPVALLPAAYGGYRIVYPDGRRRRVNAARARSLRPDAWAFHRPLPDRHPPGKADLLRLAVPRPVPDLVRLLLLGVLVGMVMLAPSIVMGMLADDAIPGASARLLIQSTLLLAALAIIGALLRTLQGTTLLKLEARAALRLDTAVQDRLFKLPSSFARRFTTGDLVTRATTFRVLRDRVSGVVVHSLLSVIFLLPAFGLLFFYSPAVGWLSLAMGLATLLIGGALGMKQIEPQRRRYAASRRLASIVHQFIGGVAKIRTSGAQESAFAIWARCYREQQQAHLEVGAYDDHLVALGTAVPAFVGGGLFWIASHGGLGGVGSFLTVYAASMVFYVAVTRLGESFAALATILPGLEQVQPLLAHETEGVASGEVVDLRGAVSLDNVSYRYGDEGPLVLQDVSMRAEPGEFVAVVGGSGAGKSTLLRLALGLAEPSAGTVTYDGRDLRRLDAASIRSRVGVVMQDGDLLEGTVRSAIVGFSNDLGLEDAWRAARLAAVDKDIAAMPMGMHTLVGEGGATLSGGQAQRIRLAAALVRNPRALFLDEATNWLDNRRQAEVIANLERLNMTRVVIAHRLSTIRHANRIYVLAGGRLVQQGTFDELAAVEGTFRDMVRRQMA